LQDLGVKFNTDHSDTETIINAYAYWGTACLKKFNGMWAFCIWDSLENTFFMARDRVGKKPLYYTTHNHSLFFASELKAILVNKEIPRVINEKAIYDFLTYATVPSPDTVFRKIRKLPAGHYIFFKPGNEIKETRYWSPIRNEKYLDGTEEQIIEGLREKIDAAVKMRLMADVEVGILLSGGIDSSINLASLNKFSAKPVKAFCLGFENKNGYKNEFEYAKKVAGEFKTDLYEYILSEKEFFDFLPEMAYYQDEPMADPANISLYYISKMAQKMGVKALMSGEGSDELFIGYKLWEIARRFESLLKDRPNLARVLGFVHKNSGLSHKRRYYHSWYSKISKKQPVFWSGTELRSEKEKHEILDEEFLRNLGEYDSYAPIREFHQLFESNQNLHNYDWMSSADLSQRLPDLLLSRLDRMSMAASVEVRSPFLDINLIEYVMRIPPHLKNKNNQEKYILKKTYEGILPQEIIYRPKNSFMAPMNDIFNDKRMRAVCMDAIEKFNQETNIFSTEYINRLRVSNSGNEMWNISNLAFWYQKYK